MAAPPDAGPARPDAQVGDAGSDDRDGDTPPGTGRIVLALTSHGDERDTRFVDGTLGIHEVRVYGDRGGDADPKLSEVGEIRLDGASPVTITLPSALPATYGRVTLELKHEDRWGPAFTVRLEHGGQLYDVSSEGEMIVDVRCDGGGASLVPEGSAQIQMKLETGHFGEALASLPLPPPSGGTVSVNEDTVSGETMNALEAAFVSAWELECAEEHRE